MKQEAVNHGYSVIDVNSRLGISIKSLSNWIKKFSKPKKAREQEADLQAEVARLNRELKSHSRQ
ncbi:MAG: transposase [Xanthomonadales bacterium]|nr:transposase [Xanthomonadales bacterium]